MHCVNINHPDFKTLKEETKLHPAILAAKIAIWQEKNNTEDFPDVTQINPSNEVSYALKAVNILASPKAEEVFKKGEKNNWSLDKILTELAIPKEQKELILDLQDPAKARIFPKGYFEKDLREQIITDLLANYSYTVEINTAKEKSGTTTKINFEENPFLDEEDFQTDGGGNTQYYSNLSAPGGTGRNKYEGNPDWEYQELEISTPLITPSIKGHAQFATPNGIGWVRVWYNKKTGVVEIQEIQSDLFQKGRDKKDLINREGIKVDVLNVLKPLESELIDYINSNELYYYGTNKSILEAKYEKTFDGERIDVKLQGEKGVNTKTLWLNRRDEEGFKYVLPKELINKINIPDVSQNQFLQLLNKDSNWVTFFIKSIIQDSAKKGYEKVLFPKGETAAKIEGHQTLADEINTKNEVITQLKVNRDVQQQVLDNIDNDTENLIVTGKQIGRAHV